MATKIGVSAASPGDEKPKATLTKEEVMRYSRHLIMPEVGMEGQLKIKAAKVLVHRHGRTRRSARPLFGGGRGGPNRLGGF